MVSSFLYISKYCIFLKVFFPLPIFFKIAEWYSIIYMYHRLFTHLPTGWHIIPFFSFLFFFFFWWLWTKSLASVCTQVFNQLGKYFREWLLNHIMRVYLVLLEIAKICSKITELIFIPMKNKSGFQLICILAVHVCMLSHSVYPNSLWPHGL